MITAAQLRAARGLLDWTRSDLAKAANVSPETIKNIEHGTFRPQETTADAIVKAFAAHDVIFSNDEGVHFDRSSIKQYSGAEEFRKFMDDVYNTACTDPEAEIGGKKPICVSTVDDRYFAEYLGDYSPFHSQRMNKINNVKVRVLVQKEDYFSVQFADYIEYKWNDNVSGGDVPFYVYGDKLAILMFNQHPIPQIVVINSKLVSSAYRQQFDILWKNAKSRQDGDKK